MHQSKFDTFFGSNAGRHRPGLTYMGTKPLGGLCTPAQVASRTGRSRLRASRATLIAVAGAVTSSNTEVEGNSVG